MDGNREFEAGGRQAQPVAARSACRVLLETDQKQPDITLEELKTALFETLAVTTGLSSIHQFFQRRDITFKKTLYATGQARADVAVAREDWTTRQSTLDPKKLVFIDETGTATNMTRLR